MHNATVCVKTAILNVPNLSFCMYKQVSLIYVGGEGIRTEKKVKQKWSEKGSPTTSSRTNSGDVVSTVDSICKRKLWKQKAFCHTICLLFDGSIRACRK